QLNSSILTYPDDGPESFQYAYIEPQDLLEPQKKFKDKKSDIYSIEKTITGTPQAYADLYKKCWSTELDERLALVNILRNLNQLSEENCVEFITNIINIDVHSSETILTIQHALYGMVSESILVICLVALLIIVIKIQEVSKTNIANLADLYRKFIT
ncbi:13462_t:CDS:2, partial [Racocetra persica]